MEKIKRRYPKLKEFIPLLKFGVVLTSVFLVPGASKAIAKVLQGPKEFDDYETNYIRSTINRLQRRGLVMMESDGDKVKITL